MRTNEVLEQLRTNAEEMTTADVAKKVVAELNRLLAEDPAKVFPAAKFMTATEAVAELERRLNDQPDATAESVAMDANIDPFMIEIQCGHFQAHPDYELFVLTKEESYVLPIERGKFLGYSITTAFDDLDTQMQAKRLYEFYLDITIGRAEDIRKKALKWLKGYAGDAKELAQLSGFSELQTRAMLKPGADLESYLLGNYRASKKLAKLYDEQQANKNDE